MLLALIIVATWGVFPDDEVSSPPKPDLTAYKEVMAMAGKNADAHVRLALWCEARAERRAAQTSVISRIGRPGPCAGTGSFGPGRLSRKMGSARRDRPTDPE